MSSVRSSGAPKMNRAASRSGSHGARKAAIGSNRPSGRGRRGAIKLWRRRYACNLTQLCCCDDERRLLQLSLRSCANTAGCCGKYAERVIRACFINLLCHETHPCVAEQSGCDHDAVLSPTCESPVARRDAIRATHGSHTGRGDELRAAAGTVTAGCRPRKAFHERTMDSDSHDCRCILYPRPEYLILQLVYSTRVSRHPNCRFHPATSHRGLATARQRHAL